MTLSRPTDRIALVTGANKGIGFEVARGIAKSGYVVLLGARNPTTGREAADTLRGQRLDARFVELDVTPMETVSATAARIEADFGKLDVLVNNAGIADAHDGPPSRVSVDVIERVLRTNFLGTVGMAQAVLPLLKKSDTGRIVNVSSDLGSITRHGDPTWKYAQVKVLGYCASKAALNMLTVQLAFELKDQGIAVNSVNPGFTATDLNAHRGQQTVEEGAAEIVRVALQEHGPSGKFLEIAVSSSGRNDAIPAIEMNAE
jgi:NAD(P)-dependent dehydrogenase (short-subunit alcohol dehydrogenase family)